MKGGDIVKEKPDTIHGRLMEAVHVSGYTLERAIKDFEWLIEENRWKSIGNGFKKIDDFLETIDFKEFKISIDQRKKIVKKLTNLGAAQRPVSKMIGVGLGTIQRDIDPSGSKKKKHVLKSLGKNEDVDPNGPSDKFDDGLPVASEEEKEYGINNLKDIEIQDSEGVMTKQLKRCWMSADEFERKTFIEWLRKERYL